MCGIAGIISKRLPLDATEVLGRMGDSLSHRGPDGQTCWINDSGNAGFAHSRLAVIDRSVMASQPMHYLERYTIVYNGEIYNYIEIRDLLQKVGYKFQTTSDTEVILAAYAHYKEDCVLRFDGMFAFVIWDEAERSIFCARDRFGEKPFYYFHDTQYGTFYFGSEMKALTAAGLKSGINNNQLLRYLVLGYTTDPADASKTFDAKFKKLPASHYIKFSVFSDDIIIKRYWNIDPSLTTGTSLKNALEQFSDLFTTSLKRRLRSDVGLGANLSGGLDSSSIVASICGQINKAEEFKTFTAVFPGFEKDEAAAAASVANLCRVGNYTVMPTVDGFIEDLEKLMYHQEEPFGSAGVYAQFKLFGLAAEHGVTVLLDGQGADEILAGYDKYRHWYLRSVFPRFTAGKLIQREISRLDNANDINADFMMAHRDDVKLRKPVVKQLNDLLYFNTFQEGLEELLRYADRNSMAWGKEVRLPFLSHELVDFVFKLPCRYKIHNRFSKWILRKEMSNKLPPEIVWTRKKTGFEPPQKQWMQQNRVKEYIHEAKKQLVKEKILNGSVLNKKQIAHGAYDRESGEWRYLIGGTYLTMK